MTVEPSEPRHSTKTARLLKGYHPRCSDASDLRRLVLERIRKLEKKLLAYGDGDSDSSEARVRIEQLQQEILALRITQNSTNRACRLPVEILANIFLEVRQQTSPGTGVPSIQAWFACTQVCALWRDVAIGCSLLWTHIDPDVAPGLMDLMIQRSKTSPLTVVSYEASWDTSSLRNALRTPEVIARLASMTHIEGGPLSNREARAWMDPRHASTPLLTYIHVETHPRTPLLAFIGPNGAPMLQTLRMVNVQVPWSSLPFTEHITTLHLVSSSNISKNATYVSHRPTIQAFRSILGRMPSLHTLHLDGYLPCAPADSSDLPPPITLPSLQLLNLRDSEERILTFFQLFEVPRASDILLQIQWRQYPYRPLATVPSILTALQRGIPDVNITKVEHLALRCFEGRTRFVFHDPASPAQDNDIEHVAGPGNPSLVLSFDTHLPDDWDVVFNPVLDAFDLSALGTLEVEVDADLHEDWGDDSNGLVDGIWTFFKPLSTVRHIEVVGSGLAASAFLRLLSETPTTTPAGLTTSSDASSGSSEAFAGLEGVRFRNLTFQDSSDEKRRAHEIVDLLRGALVARPQLRVSTFRNKVLTEADVEAAHWMVSLSKPSGGLWLKW